MDKCVICAGELIRNKMCNKTRKRWVRRVVKLVIRGLTREQSCIWNITCCLSNMLSSLNLNRHRGRWRWRQEKRGWSLKRGRSPSMGWWLWQLRQVRSLTNLVFVQSKRTVKFLWVFLQKFGHLENPLLDWDVVGEYTIKNLGHIEIYCSLCPIQTKHLIEMCPQCQAPKAGSDSLSFFMYSLLRQRLIKS